jgi:hypothetical protein
MEMDLTYFSDPHNVRMTVMGAIEAILLESSVEREIGLLKSEAVGISTGLSESSWEAGVRYLQENRLAVYDGRKLVATDKGRELYKLTGELANSFKGMSEIGKV